MKFRFAFAKLLDHRQKLEDIARRNWVEARNKVDEANRKLQTLFDEIEGSRQRAGSLQKNGGPCGAALAQIDDFINGQKIRIETLRSEIRRLMAETERLHGILLEAAKERKALEKIRERRLEEFKLLKKKKELKIVDEIVVTRFKGDGESTR